APAVPRAARARGSRAPPRAPPPPPPRPHPRSRSATSVPPRIGPPLPAGSRPGGRVLLAGSRERTQAPRGLPVVGQDFTPRGGARGPPRHAADAGGERPHAPVPQADVHGGGVIRLGHRRVAHGREGGRGDLELRPRADLAGWP